jgi:hypothetical protein
MLAGKSYHDSKLKAEEKKFGKDVLLLNANGEIDGCVREGGMTDEKTKNFCCFSRSSLALFHKAEEDGNPPHNKHVHT